MRKSFILPLAMTSMLILSAAANPTADAVKSAARAEKALAKNKPADAIGDAEAAVAAVPHDASYRMLLGRAYLESGRFRSAAAAFSDVLALDPSRGSAALSLALTRLGLGDRDGAREALDAHAALIPAGDRGLALALAGDPAAGVKVLEDTIRAGGADAKTRQNLALSYALSGRWSEAKVMASFDLDPQTVARRMLDWSRFAGAGQAAVQVAALLGVQPREDAGQPIRLALNLPSATPVRTAEAAPPPPPVPMTEAPPVEVATIAAEAETLFTQTPAQAIVFAPRSEIVQAIMPRMPEIAPRPVQAVARFQRAAFVQPQGGRFVVQIGAYDSLGVAEDGWTRAVRRNAALSEFTPSTAVFVKGGTTFYRLSVGGFTTRGTAVTFCEQYRARGGHCFVREQAGDAPLQWAGRSGGNVRLASR